MKRIVGRPLPLGVSVNQDEVNFSIVLSSGKKCSLVLYKKGEELPILEEELCEKDGIGEVRFAAFRGLAAEELAYSYIIDGENIIDPYAKGICEGKGLVMTESYDWEDDRPLRIPYHQIVAYSLHVRGFTMSDSSTIHKGTFKGVAEKIPYLQELGVNQIHCMPVYAFEEGDKYINYWGYGNAYGFAVQKRYASGSSPETELKDMIKAMHKAGIEVVLNLPFSDGMPKQLIIDCLRYYVMEYHVDGFILNAGRAPMEQISEDPLLKGTKILQNKDDFQNVMRRFLKGDEGLVEAAMWWLSKGTLETGSCNYITSHNGFTLQDLVSYNEKHNEANGEENKDGPNENYSWNCGEEGPSRKKGVQQLRKKQMRNAMFLLLMAQGTPCILSGDEFGNSQNGNNNVYCQDNKTAWVDWTKLEKEEEFFTYVKELIALRKKYPILHADRLLKGTDQIGYGVPDISYHGESAWRPLTDRNSRQLGIYYHDADGTDLYLAYNLHYDAKKLALPVLANKKEWHLIFSTAANVEADVVCEKQILIDPRTIVMFEGR